MIKLKSLIPEKFFDVAQAVGKDKDDWVTLSDPPANTLAKSDKELKINLFNLIDNTYKTFLKKPHVGIKGITDIFGTDYDWWEAIDIDENPDAEAVIFGKKKHGIKISGIGHDGEMMSKSILVYHLSEILNEKGFWTEASDNVARVLLQKNVNVIKDIEKIKKIVGGEILKTYDDGSYERRTPEGRITHREYLFGNPL